MKLFDKIMLGTLFGISLLFTYGKYFVDTTEIAKLESSMYAMLFVVLALFIYMISKLEDIKQRLEKKV